MEIKHFEEYDCVYDENNNLIEVYENQILTCRYKYNKHSKITREDNLLLNTSIEYKYNEFNKLVQRSFYDYTLHNLKNVKYTDNFTYDSNNHITSYNDERFSYDKNGNTSIFRNAKLKISNSNLIKLDNFTFKYDVNNCRTTKYYRKTNTLIRHKIRFIYKDNSITGFKLNNECYFYKKNYNNDIVGIYNSNLNLICRYVYDCLGNHKYITSDFNNETIADINPFRFHSNYFDIELGLYFINGRFYDSEIDCYLN